MEQPIRFPGQYADPETGFHYNYFRDYAPDLGRYVQADPRGILLDFSDPQRQVAAKVGVKVPEVPSLELNHNYGYVQQNPVNFTDPTGEWWFVPPLVIAGATGVLMKCSDNLAEKCRDSYPDDHNKRTACAAALIAPGVTAASAVIDPAGFTASEAGGATCGKKCD